MDTTTLKKNAVIETLMDELLKEDIHYLNLQQKLYDFRDVLLDITHLDLNDLEDRKDLQFDNGIALCTTFAALCIQDVMRTRQFIRGIYQAVTDKLSENQKPVHIFYAGTGPFATLILPILTKFDATQIRLTLMDVNEKTLDYLDNVIQALSIEDYINTIVCADASAYQFEEDQQVDILVSETMQYGLVKEQQVPIMINLVQQLPKESIVIPNNIHLDLAYKDSSANLVLEGKNHLIYKTIQPLLDFTPEFIYALNGRGKEQQRFELCENLDFSKDKVAYNKLVVLTSIQVYKDEWIQADLSSLTIPKELFAFDDIDSSKTQLSLSYVIKEQPDFEVELS
jgi:predicted RNA methylase